MSLKYIFIVKYYYVAEGYKNDEKEKEMKVYKDIEKKKIKRITIIITITIIKKKKAIHTNR